MMGIGGIINPVARRNTLVKGIYVISIPAIMLPRVEPRLNMLDRYEILKVFISGSTRSARNDHSLTARGHQLNPYTAMATTKIL